MNKVVQAISKKLAKAKESTDSEITKLEARKAAYATEEQAAVKAMEDALDADNLGAYSEARKRKEVAADGINMSDKRIEALQAKGSFTKDEYEGFRMQIATELSSVSAKAREEILKKANELKSTFEAYDAEIQELETMYFDLSKKAGRELVSGSSDGKRNLRFDFDSMFNPNVPRSFINHIKHY